MIPDDWTLEKSFGCAWRMMRGDRRYHVRIIFDREFARNVADTLWHPTQTIELLPDGQCEFKCRVDGLDEIVWWVLGYGPHARVLEPAELVKRIVHMAARMQKVYGPDGPRRVRNDRAVLAAGSGESEVLR